MLEAREPSGSSPSPRSPPLHAAPEPAVALVAAWREAGPRLWFARKEDFDDSLRSRFGELHDDAAAGRLSGWLDTAEGALALVLLTDQLSRNLHRGSAQAFALDGAARAAADGALVRGFDQLTAGDLRPFLYMPYTHSEDPVAQARGVALFTRLAQAGEDRGDGLRYALIHQEVIRRFGRFPHRNAVLGRTTTDAEARFLAEGGFAG